MKAYLELLEIMRARRSVRQFTDRPVERDDILRLLEAARWAPSNHNRQPWRFLVIEDPTQIRQLAELVGHGLSERLKSLPGSAAHHAGDLTRHATFFAHAPVLLAVLHKQPVSLSARILAGLKNPELVSGEPLSGAMAVQNLLLAAQTLRLGTCVLTGPLLVQPALIEALVLPAGHELTCLVAVGHPAEAPAAPRRKTIDQIVEFRNHPRVEQGLQ